MKEPAKYIITQGPFNGQTDSIEIARKVLKDHVKRMKELYNSDEKYSIYMLVDSKSIKDFK